MIAMAGMNPMRFLFEEDQFIRSVMQAVADRRISIAEDERQDQAERIISVLGRSIK
jgi:hypothetical protein